MICTRVSEQGIIQATPSRTRDTHYSSTMRNPNDPSMSHIHQILYDAEVYINHHFEVAWNLHQITYSVEIDKCKLIKQLDQSVGQHYLTSGTPPGPLLEILVSD
jgi:hypothetical protein